MNTIYKQSVYTHLLLVGSVLSCSGIYADHGLKQFDYTNQDYERIQLDLQEFNDLVQLLSYKYGNQVAQDTLGKLNALLSRQVHDADNALSKSINPLLCNTLDIRTLICRIGNVLINLNADLSTQIHSELEAYCDGIHNKLDTINSKLDEIISIVH